MTEFKSWRDIKDWATKNGFAKIAKRMQINNDYWMSSGEFGRSQVQICDALRWADTEDERLIIAGEIEKELASDEVLKLIKED